MRIESTTTPGPEWEAFVLRTPNGSLSHSRVWLNVVREAYGIETVGLMAVSGAEATVHGVLPLGTIRTLAGRKELVSMPFLDGGGILTGKPDAEARLAQASVDEAARRGARVVELRQERALAAVAAPDCGRVRMVLPIPETEDELWSGLRGKVRNQVRKARKEGLSVAAGNDVASLDGFYAPYRTNMRELGSPAHGRRFYAAAAAGFGDALRCFVVRDGTRPVGGLVAIHHGDTVTVPWASTLRAERARCPNNLIYWEAMRWAVQRGATAFDFGRSPPGSGTHRFKRGWGAVEQPLAWLRLDPSGQPLSLAHPGDSPCLRRAAWLWQRLPPKLCHWLGPRVRPRLAS